MESKIVGQLKPLEHDDEWAESTPIHIPYFDNLPVKVIFTESSFESYMKRADKVLEDFLKLTTLDRAKHSDLVHKYYKEALNSPYAKRLDLKSIDEIWNYAKPTEIIIQEDSDGTCYLCVSCECDWEVEHGLCLVFKNGNTLTRASGHDGHFTD